jgi:hypothetical protein
MEEVKETQGYKDKERKKKKTIFDLKLRLDLVKTRNYKKKKTFFVVNSSLSFFGFLPKFNYRIRKRR